MKMLSALARRASSRRGVVLPCQVVRERDFKLVAEQTLDISVDGLLLPLRANRGAGPVLTGDALIVSFAVQGLWIDAEATVARVVHGRRAGDEGPAIGVIFEHISPSSRAVLAAFLHGRRPTAPRRAPLDASTALFGIDLVDEADVVDDDEEPGAASVDGLGVLRAVVDAWQTLLEAPRTAEP